MTYTIGSLCTGFGGLDLAVETVLGPARHLWHAEYDPDPDVKDPLWKGRILAAYWPDVPNLGDLSAVDWAAVERPDVLTAGFPCTDISSAGRRAGMGAGTRSGVWSHVAEAIAALRPRLVLIENVDALLSTPANRTVDGSDGDMESGPAGLGNGAGRFVLRALGAVLGDLATLGFDAEWVGVAASDVGACHRRRRVFILAWPADSEGVGYWHAGAQGLTGVPAAAVAGGVGADGLSLLPTPAARLGGDRGTPSVGTAGARFESGRRNLEDAVALLPTPTARDGAGRGEGSVDYWQQREGREAGQGAPLGAVVNLLPTLRATDGTKGGSDQRGSSGDLTPPSAVMALLPTPRVAATRTSRGTILRSSSSPSLEQAVELAAGPVPREVASMANAPAAWAVGDGARWGRYASAIHHWEQVMGRPAPEPTELGSKGQSRLSAKFVEWMQGLPDGWVTGHVSRNQALHALGDGVVWQQGAYALRLLLTNAVRQVAA